MPDLPFTLDFDGEVVELPPDSTPTLDRYEQIASYHVGEPWVPPPALDADAVTVVARHRYESGSLVPHMYEVTYWRRASGG